MIVSDKMKEVIILNGVSNKGKNLVRQFGERWTILERREFVACLKGPGFSIVPEGRETQSDKLSRWWTMQGDLDFQHIFIEKV